jgi:hypothetical protein
LINIGIGYSDEPSELKDVLSKLKLYSYHETISGLQLENVKDMAYLIV